MSNQLFEYKQLQVLKYLEGKLRTNSLNFKNQEMGRDVEQDAMSFYKF